jgi:aminoglycoside phosphotransferase (APT) family kinase protein
VRQFGGGKANLTYLLRFGSNEFVLRRPPLGPIPPGAHDMRREHRVLSMLYRRYKPAPRSLLLCEDESLIGAVFIVEERRHGFVIRDDIPPEFAGRPELNRRIGDALVDALADLHRVSPGEVGLGDLGRPEGYAARQLEGWTRRWHAAQGGEEAERSVAAMAPALDWLGAHLPQSGTAALLHNDYRLDNCLLDSADPGRIEAVLDWDMCTQGDPLADLGYVLNYWVEPGDPPEWRDIASMPTWREGFPTRADAIRRYAARTGFDVSAVGWHQVFAAFKLAVIIQQIYIRFVRGQTQDQRFRHYYRRVQGLAKKTRLLVELA